MNSGVNALLQYDITEIIEAMMSYVDFLDSSYHEKSNNIIMHYWQSKEIILKSVLLTDLLDWLCCLAFSDGFIAPEEVQFINTHLKQKLSAEDIIESCKIRINQDYFKNLPLSFILFYENDLVMRSLDEKEDFNSVQLLYNLFMIIGAHFIYCDNNVDFKELAMLNGYTEDLSNRICDFNYIQEYLAILEVSNGDLVDEYSSNRYPFSQDIINNYIDELDNIDEIPPTTSFSDIKVNQDNIRSNEAQITLRPSSEIKTADILDLVKNPNDYYNFNGEFENHFIDFKDLFTSKNRYKIELTFLTPQQYRSILNKIKFTSDNILNKTINENNIDLNCLSIFEKILLFTKSFVDVEYKSSGAPLGEYSFNKIYLDDRLDDANQIITLIHELSHHLLAEIFEQAAMILLNTDKTDVIEYYVGFILSCSAGFPLINEYCAHSVEGRFTPHGYQNYGSFEKILERFDEVNDEEEISESKKLGNTFCQDILSIIEPFIDNNLREEIKQQFKMDLNYPPTYRGIWHEIDDTLEVYHLISLIHSVLLVGFDEALENPELFEEYRKKFD